MAGTSAGTAASVGNGPSPEREALDRVLRSDVMDRAPNLILFLRYVCEMQLAGRPDAIKEYNVAVEALGRSSDFDQKKDSIVRVEAHRLRKRLAEYYRTAGAEDPVEIVLPAGTYVPEFRRRNAGVEQPVAIHETAADSLSSKRRKLVPWIPLIALLGATAVLLGFVIWKTSRFSASTIAEASARREAATPGSASIGGAVRILAGGTRDGVPDSFANLWSMDRFFTGGDVVTAPPRPIQRTLDGAMYLTRREGEFQYRIPALPGTYELRLHFAETVFGEGNVAGGGESSRVFGIQVNGGEVWIGDVLSEAAGPNTATVRVYRGVRPGSDGFVGVSFFPVRKEAPFVNAIELLPAPGGNMLPIRMAARAAAVTDTEGRTWDADRFWLGGQPVQRHENIEGPEATSIYQGERYGNFSYAMPVAMGSTYTLTLRFAETWFGQGRPGGGGAGSRIFDVYCNGRALLRNFDVLKEAGGPMRQVKKIFRGLEPTAQGKLNLQFVPVRNYAMINAIEIVDEGSH